MSSALRAELFQPASKPGFGYFPGTVPRRRSASATNTSLIRMEKFCAYYNDKRETDRMLPPDTICIDLIAILFYTFGTVREWLRLNLCRTVSNGFHRRAH
jgi:hypothetical protein